VMFAGVGIIGALASILASILVPPPPSSENDDDEHPSGSVRAELSSIRTELAAIRQLLTAQSGDPPDR